MKIEKRITATILSLCLLMGLVFVPVRAQEVDGSGHRGDACNNGITTVKTPVSKEKSGLLWANCLGNPSFWEYPGPPTIANEYIYTYCTNKIYKLDKLTGEILEEKEMAGSKAFGGAWGSTYFPLTYGDGKIFAALEGGRIQAFDADTLESLWVYTDESANDKTYASSPLVYEDRKVYVGFDAPNGAPFVCVSSEDGTLVWNTTEDGSFNWDGAAIVGNYVIYANSLGNVICRNKINGESVDKLEINFGEIKTSVCYDNGKIYCMTGRAVLVVADFDESSGKFSNLKTINCSTYGQGSTSTPVVYNGIVYAGVGSWGSGKVVAVDPAEEEILWAIEEPSFPQGSILLSNAYEKEGYLYLYITYNGEPGGINVVKVKPNGSEPEQSELFDAAEYANFCMASVISDAEGTLYYKNDSGNIMAIATTDKIAVTETEKKIANIPYEEDITLDDENDINAARISYDALTDEQKGLVSTDSILVLLDAESRIQVLKVDKTLGELPDVGQITLQNEKAVFEARKQYNVLTREQKKELSPENVWNLLDAERKLSQLKEAENNVARKIAAEKDLQAAEKVEKQIESIGTVTLSKVDTVKLVKEQYDKLTKNQKSLISVEAIVTLKEAVAASDNYIKDAKTNAYYKVTKTGRNGTVTYIKPITKKTSVVIPVTIPVKGHLYKVTAISAKAFRKNTTVKKVTIGKNVSRIGKEAFYGCKNLKKVQIKSLKLSSKSVGSKSFKGIDKKAKMKVPKSKVESYAKWVKTKGSASIKVTR
ncbi:MAG: PQQ-binding-like beta-propeller repeat protein [Anaerobutyricum sp.]|nr:PQQ-binding-like beta-propeller repeat protein [Anaerobutyricum sp.]